MNLKKLLGFINTQKLVILFFIIFISSSFLSDYYFTFTNIVNLFTQVSLYGIVACGMTFIVISGEFDISVGSIMALGAVIAVSLYNSAGLFISIITLVALVLIIGLIYSFLVIKIKINSFIATLAGMVFFRGVAFLITRDGTPIKPNDGFYQKIAMTSLWGIPLVVYYFLIFVAISAFVLKKTTLGRNIYATGSSYETAKFAGVNVVFYKTAAFTICALGAVFAGFMMASRFNVAAPIAADDAALSALSAVVLGGTSLSGGSGSVFGTLIGVMILGLITNALNMLGVNSYIQLAIKGLLLILFISIERYSKNRVTTNT